MEENNILTYRSIKPIISEIPFQVREAINVLRGNIQMSGKDIKVIAITSALAHEGKSSIAFRLANSFASLGKRTVYLDCDIRNSMTLDRYKIENEVVGLSEYLCGRVELNEIIYGTENQFLNIIFTGSYAPNPSELVSSDMFQDMINKLKNKYDYVIVDTPPVNPVIDGILIAKQCDGTVIVVESGITEKKEAIRAKQQLEYAGIKILGGVLNKFGTSKSGYSKYGYGYGYGYGEKNSSKKKKKTTKRTTRAKRK